MSQRRLVNVVFACLLVGLCVLTWNTFDGYRLGRSTSERLLKLQELRGIIIHSDEVLTMSAAMAASTGDRRWEERYREYEPLLQSAIEGARDLVAETYDAAAAGATDAANVALGQMEAQALQLMREGRLEEAQAIFSGDTYSTLKRLYAEGMREIAEHLQNASAHTLEEYRRRSLAHVLLLICLLPTLAGSWFFVNRGLRRNEQRTESLEESLHQVTVGRGEFLSRMSHAVRSPMTAILGYTDMMLDGETSAEEREQNLRIMRRNEQHLLSLLDDLLRLSDLQAGKVMIEPAACSPFEIVSDVAIQVTTQAAERGIAFDIEYVGRIPAMIETDAERVRQILTSLTRNAIHFTESGGVRVVTRLVNSESESPQLKIEVLDTGVGMTPEQCREIFDAFPQGEGTDRRTSGGTGLSLAIGKVLAGMLGGDLQVQSAVGRGSRFILTLDPGCLEDTELVESPPIARLSDVARVAEPAAMLSLQGRVLVAEDMADARVWLSSLLGKAGLDVETAENGEIAFEKAMAAVQLDEPYDCILMDMQMPVLSGYDATAKLRHEGYTNAVIAVTSHALEGDREKCLQAGCDDYVPKPVDRDQLFMKLATYLKRQI